MRCTAAGKVGVSNQACTPVMMAGPIRSAPCRVGPVSGGNSFHRSSVIYRTTSCNIFHTYATRRHPLLPCCAHTQRASPASRRAVQGTRGGSTHTQIRQSYSSLHYIPYHAALAWSPRHVALLAPDDSRIRADESSGSTTCVVVNGHTVPGMTALLHREHLNCTYVRSFSRQTCRMSRHRVAALPCAQDHPRSFFCYYSCS